MNEVFSLNGTGTDLIVSHCSARSPEYNNSNIHLSEDGYITFLSVHATFDTFQGDTFNLKLAASRIKFKMAPTRRLKTDTAEVSYLWGLYSYSRVRQTCYSTPRSVTLKNLDLFLEYFKEQLSRDTNRV